MASSFFLYSHHAGWTIALYSHSCFIAFSAYSEPKVLICEHDLDDWVKDYFGLFEEDCAKSGNDSENFKCKSLAQAQREVEFCKILNLDWSHQILIVLDTEKLDSGFGEMSFNQCYKEASIFEKVAISSTPFVISISGHSRGAMWNIDRKTLLSGWGDRRTAQCKIKAIDTSENQL